MSARVKFDRTLTRSLNQHSTCSFLDQDLLEARLSLTGQLRRMVSTLPATHPHLFSSSPVFISRDDVEAIKSLVTTVHAVAARVAYREAVLREAPEIALFEPNSKGVFFGWDFHLSDDGPKLIEINTNAGGAYLNWALLEAQRACCDEAHGLMREPLPNITLLATWQEMFHIEAGHHPVHVAIVDQRPDAQYLYPEFLLAQAIGQKAGSKVSIVDPSQLAWTGEALLADGQPVDLVYNRLTDFYFEEPTSEALKAAYLSGRVTVTPHPHAHALFANKANLALLTDPEILRSFGASPEERAILLGSIPRTRNVTPELAQSLWADRKNLFFKPRHGFGSRAAYRGAKIMTRVWQEILSHDYVAQDFVRPPERTVCGEKGAPSLKFDLRAYVYAGKVQLLAARLYEGQTTNFRTVGGGFAPVYLAPEPS